MYVKILADSVNPWGNRLTTFEVKMHRYILAEFNTHRVFSRNTASSRAIPTKKIIWQVLKDPAIPSSWGFLQKGMQARKEMSFLRAMIVKRLWLLARYPAVMFALLMYAFKLHKQVANRILEPWMWVTTIVSSTEWDNFIKLRCSSLAQPEMQDLANAIREALLTWKPTPVSKGAWHLPYVSDEEKSMYPSPTLLKISVARCARVSYLRQNECDLKKDVQLHDELAKNGHLSPFEHVACSWETGTGNFQGWYQYRKAVEKNVNI